VVENILLNLQEKYTRRENKHLKMIFEITGRDTLFFIGGIVVSAIGFAIWLYLDDLRYK